MKIFVCDNKKTKQGNISFRSVPCMWRDVMGENGPLSDLKNLPRFQECDLKYVFAFERIIPNFDIQKSIIPVYVLFYKYMLINLENGPS